MTTYLALLRGINVGSTTKVEMQGLRKLFEALGHGEVRTHLRTGNVIFTASGRKPSLVAGIEKRIAEDLGVRTTVLLRTAAELAKVASGNPLAGGRRDESKLHVTFLAEPPDRGRISELDALAGAQEEFAVAGREVYLYCPNGYGRTKLSNANLEKRLGVTATTRSWKVTTKLHELASG